MSDLYNRLSEADLVKTVKQGQSDVFFLREFLFPNVDISESGHVDILKMQAQHSDIASYGSFCVSATPIGGGESSQVLDTIKLPEINEKKMLMACDVDDLNITKTGQLLKSYSAKWKYAQAELASTFKQRIEKLQEYQAAEILTTGKVTLRGKDAPEAVIDFGRDANLDPVTTAADLWTATTSDPIQHIEDLSEMTMQYGGAAMDMILTPKAWKALRNHASYKEYKDMEIKGGCFSCADGNTGAPVKPQYVRRLPNFGDFSTWLYNAPFYMRDANGDFTKTPLLEDGDIFLVNREAFNGIKAYGGIKTNGSIIKTDIRLRSVVCNDPEGLKIISQSKNMLVPANVNAFVKTKVA